MSTGQGKSGLPQSHTLEPSAGLQPQPMLPLAEGEEEEPEAEYLPPDYIVVLEGMDYDFYLSQFPPKTWIADPAEHYLYEGWKGGYDPCPEFSTTFYLEYNRDVRESGIHPFVHYLNYGKTEGRACGPWSESEHYNLVAPHLDTEFYMAQLRRAEKVRDPVVHYLTDGWRRGLDPHPDFSTGFYLQRYPDVRNTGRNPYVHYLQFGRSEGRAATRAQLAAQQTPGISAESSEG